MDNIEELAAKCAALMASVAGSLQKLARADREISVKLAKLGFADCAGLAKLANESDDHPHVLAAMALELEGLPGEIKEIRERDAQLSRKWDNRPVLDRGTENEFLQ